MATIVEGNPKAPFSIATTPRCRGGRYSFPGLLYFTLDPYLIMLSVKQGGIKYHFLSLWYDSTWDWTQVSQAIGKHSNRWANTHVYIPIYTQISKKTCCQSINSLPFFWWNEWISFMSILWSKVKMYIELCFILFIYFLYVCEFYNGQDCKKLHRSTLFTVQYVLQVLEDNGLFLVRIIHFIQEYLQQGV